MQLTQFMVIVAFTHLRCEAQSVSTWYVDQSMNNIEGECKNKLLDELQDKCLKTSGGSRVYKTNRAFVSLIKVKGVRPEIALSDHVVTLNHVTVRTRRAETCQNGKCVKKCEVDFVS
ncbi:secreted salivary gland peptide, putative [Ixodes scapularis]|uniref:Secreted salivary gland peptide, putative n=1 Tax=Ixodes scapularis TaxID=6945 RepID=B7QKL1_IXOSC|nr:secreted salivary gland peptide, putative [Ixodes scapularis]|eukprot:XP_002415716.1 secreted salivary gland peptide, putative [Ixodes scapularis]